MHLLPSRSSTIAFLLSTILGATACADMTPDDAEPAADDADENVGSIEQAVTLDTHTVFGQTGVQLDARVASEKAAGYRPMTVSAYGTSSSDVRFAASFVKRAGADWRVYRGIGLAAFQTVFDGMAEDRYKPTMFSFDGSESNPVWVAVFEKTSGGIPYTRSALVSGSATNSNTIEYWLLKAKKDKLIPTAFSTYGSATSPRYAIVLEPNTTRVAWSIGTISSNNDMWTGFGLNETAADHVARFNAQTSARNRPTNVSINAGGRYATLYRADSAGSWAYKSGLTAAQLSSEITAQQTYGRVATFIEGSGTGSNTRYDAIFAESDLPRARTFQAYGSGTAADPAIPAIDDVFKTFMARNDVRQAGVAVLSGKRLVYARGYNLAEPGYPAVDAKTRFRLASVSKTITAMEIMRLVDKHGLNVDTPVQDILQLKTWQGKEPDERFATITVKNLLQHSFPTLTDADGTVNCLKGDADTSLSAAKAMGLKLPLSRDASIGYTLAASDLIRPRGDGRCYSNFGYVLLSKVVEKYRNRSFNNALIQDLVAPLAVKRFATSRPVNLVDEAFYKSGSAKVWSSVNVDGAPLAPAYHAGWNFDVYEASGGLSMAPPDVARMLAMLNTGSTNPVYDNRMGYDGEPTTVDTLLTNRYGFDGMFSAAAPGLTSAFVKGGDIDGLQSSVVFRPGGISYVLFFARSELSPSGLAEDSWYPTWGSLEKVLVSLNVSSLPDLFPLYGMPSL